jgi:phage head maturation protease
MSYIYPGGPLKTVQDGNSQIVAEGYLAVFGGKGDLSSYKDIFTSRTDFGWDELHEGKTILLPAYYDHGLDHTVRKERLGSLEAKLDDKGVFAQYTIRRRLDYLKKVKDELGDDAFGQSSGAVYHLVDRSRKGQGHEILQWQLGEGSITPEPADPRTTLAIKSLAEYAEEREAAYKHLAAELAQISILHTLRKLNRVL